MSKAVLRWFCLVEAAAASLIGVTPPATVAREPDRIVELWPEMAPGEREADVGEALPQRPDEKPPATRIRSITQPRLMLYQPAAAKRTGTMVVIFPGGGYNYVVVDKEGSEAAEWLNELGITAAVLHYRTKDNSNLPLWQRPLQDGQRAVRWLRANAEALGVSPQQIGVLGFSAGGQVAALVATRSAINAYEPTDETDRQSCRPDFAMLLYPWRLVDAETQQLMPEVTIQPETPPTLLIHTHDDQATSLSSVLFYAELKRQQIPAELHVFRAGGHGYGLRPVANTNIHQWPQYATEWLRGQALSPR